MTDHKAEGIQALKEMREAKCDINIVLTHSRTGVDLEFWYAAVVIEGLRIDALVGGHDHYTAYLKLTYNGLVTQFVKTAELTS